MEEMEKAIAKDPTLPEKWRIEGERQYQMYLERQAQGREARTEAGEIIIPIVFHLVDAATALAGITDRDIYEQVEYLNRDYQGRKADRYVKVIPPEIYARVGKVGVKFVLARRTPGGALTTGIERRVNATPSHIDIKANATGGLDAWDPTKYVNVWAGTFSGGDAGLLGIATFPFTTGEGAQGVVIGLNTLPYTSNTARGYYPEYSEGATLPHEIGHYLYLWHTFGDLTTCNNQDFRIQSGWPLPTGAGPEGDDTPAEQAGPGNAYFGNPSMNYAGACTTEPFGIVYGSFMNYYDDRALFMFTEGHRKRIIGCIDLYRAGLKTSDGATPPTAVTDAFLVTVSPRGLPERRSYFMNNSPLTATVRNSGTSNLTSVAVNVSMDGGAPITTIFPLTLAPGRDTTLPLANISAAAGNHTMTIYTTAPNSTTDAFLNNDTLQSFIAIKPAAVLTAPFTESFTATTFPPTNWQTFNPNGGTLTWARSATVGFTAAGSATVNNYNYTGVGQLDELITPGINFGANDSSILTFRVAHAVYDAVDVSTWDGLEVYVSGDGGVTYTLAYKKTGNQLKTIAAAQTGSFAPTAAQTDRWRLESINLTPYIVSGKQMIIKFRNTTAFGNNTYIDDVNVTAAVRPNIDLAALSINGVPDFSCSTTLTPSLTVKNLGVGTINNYKVSYSLDGGAVVTTSITTPLTTQQTATITLGNLTIPAGNHTLLVYTSDPNGAVDPVTGNDTLRKSFLIVPIVTAPLTESFENPTFPPAGWAVTNPDNGTTWQRTTLAVRRVRNTDSASAYVNNFNYTGTNRVDELYTPTVRYSSVDSVFLKFDVAASTFNYSGATNVGEDTLEVLITRDCGATFQSVYKKWGTQLQTLGDPNAANNIEFKPGDRTVFWRTDSVNLTGIAGTTSAFQVVFRNTHNAPGNNIYLDNVNLNTRILPASLKQQGYLILPTAFTSQFGVWHYEQPTTLKYIRVFNAVGQLIWTSQYNGNANKFTLIDLSGKPAGVYVVRLGYDDASRNVSQRVIKY